MAADSELHGEAEDLAEILDGLHSDHPEDEALALEEEAKWVSESDDLTEIDIDGDPELRALEEMETALTEAPLELEPETGEVTHAGWQQQEETVAETDVDLDTVRETEVEIEKEPPLEHDLDDDSATTLLTLPTLEQATVVDEEEDAMVAAARTAGEDEPWQEEVIDIPVADHKLEPQFDELPGEAAVVAAAGAALLAKGARSKHEEVEAPVKVVKKRTGAGLPMSSTQKLWLAAAVLLVLSAGLLMRTDWWEYTLFNWRSPYRLSALESSWRNHSVGQLLLVQGEVTNHGSSAPPWVRISLMDGKNKTLATVLVVPGRVVDKRVLDGSGEQAIQAMIRLQGQERTSTETSWASHRLPFQAIFVNPPGEVTRFQVDFSTVGTPVTQQKAQL